ncbi:hypothetical protein PLICRDRAFT_174252 [Plicaturopsis crispa FD-325 SS-3]|nr:hypothetical protein PLICRDRAFT_174252 [Plicaturopsis crispa FD-325 SS-3]
MATAGMQPKIYRETVVLPALELAFEQHPEKVSQENGDISLPTAVLPHVIASQTRPDELKAAQEFVRDRFPMQAFVTARQLADNFPVEPESLEKPYETSGNSSDALHFQTLADEVRSSVDRQGEVYRQRHHNLETKLTDTNNALDHLEDRLDGVKESVIEPALEEERKRNRRELEKERIARAAQEARLEETIAKLKKKVEEGNAARSRQRRASDAKLKALEDSNNSIELRLVEFEEKTLGLLSDLTRSNTNIKAMNEQIQALSDAVKDCKESSVTVQDLQELKEHMGGYHPDPATDLDTMPIDHYHASTAPPYEDSSDCTVPPYDQGTSLPTSMPFTGRPVPCDGHSQPDLRPEGAGKHVGTVAIASDIDSTLQNNMLVVTDVDSLRGTAVRHTKDAFPRQHKPLPVLPVDSIAEIGTVGDGHDTDVACDVILSGDLQKHDATLSKPASEPGILRTFQTVLDGLWGMFSTMSLQAKRIKVVQNATNPGPDESQFFASFLRGSLFKDAVDAHLQIVSSDGTRHVLQSETHVSAVLEFMKGLVQRFRSIFSA